MDVLGWREENAEKEFGKNVGLGEDVIFGRTDRVVMDNGVVEFG